MFLGPFVPEIDQQETSFAASPSSPRSEISAYEDGLIQTRARTDTLSTDQSAMRGSSDGFVPAEHQDFSGMGLGTEKESSPSSPPGQFGLQYALRSSGSFIPDDIGSLDAQGAPHRRHGSGGDLAPSASIRRQQGGPSSSSGNVLGRNLILGSSGYSHTSQNERGG